MRLNVVAIGQRMPAWVQEAWSEYARRFTRGISLELREVAAIKRGRNADIASIRQREGEALLAAVPPSTHVLALDEQGKQWSTTELAEKLEGWMQSGVDLSFLIGGPDGLSNECLNQAAGRWSLGRLTLPHPLVRVILAEQLYRAWTVTRNHPYHRE